MFSRVGSIPPACAQVQLTVMVYPVMLAWVPSRRHRLITRHVGHAHGLAGWTSSPRETGGGLAGGLAHAAARVAVIAAWREAHAARQRCHGCESPNHVGNADQTAQRHTSRCVCPIRTARHTPPATTTHPTSGGDRPEPHPANPVGRAEAGRDTNDRTAHRDDPASLPPASRPTGATARPRLPSARS